LHTSDNKRLTRLALCLGVMFVCGSAHAARQIIVIGDSTEWGASPTGQSWAQPAKALAKLLQLAPTGNPWRGAHVLNCAVPATTTFDWVTTFNPKACKFFGIGFNACLRTSCQRHEPLGAAVPEIGKRVDAVLVVLGTNDYPTNDPVGTVDRIAMLRALLAPARVFIAPPFPTTDPDRMDFVPLVRAELLARGLLTGPDWPLLPTWDGLHLTDGGYAAAAGLWVDALLGQLPATTVTSTSSTTTTSETTSTTLDSP